METPEHPKQTNRQYLYKIHPEKQSPNENDQL